MTHTSSFLLTGFPATQSLHSFPTRRSSDLDEMRLRRADGEYRWFLVRTVPLRDEQGNIVKWYGTSTDIEDRKRAEDALRERSEEHTSELQSPYDLVCRLLLEKKKKKDNSAP